VTAYTNHGKTSSARRNSDWKPKLSERDRHTLKRIVAKNQNYHSKGDSRNWYSTWRPCFHKKKKNCPIRAHKSNVHGGAAIFKTLITENSTKRWKIWCDDHKARTSDNWKYVI
jgi:hypothetical protein